MNEKTELNDDGSGLALERRRLDTDIPGVEYREDVCPVGKWERIRIYSEEGAKSISRPIGLYDTLSLERMDMLTPSELDDATEEIASGLCRMFECERVYPDRLLIVGLGNGELTPDAVGPLSASMVEATMHLKRKDKRAFYMLECSELAVIAPGVTARSGIDVARTVSAIAKEIAPDAIIAIDSLAARSPTRLGTTVQISSTGIIPASAVTSRATPINKETAGCPVFAIGVPTVINAQNLIKSEEHYSYLPNMLVAPKDIDGIVRNSAKIIAGGINQAFGISY